MAMTSTIWRGASSMAEIIRSILAQRTSHETEGPRPIVREFEAAEPYPAEALGPLRSACHAVQEHTRAPLAVCAQAVLGAVSLVAQAHADVVLPTGQTKPTSLFLLTIAASGERKSAVDSLALRSIYEREAELHKAYGTEQEAFKLANEIWEAQRTQAKAEMRPGKTGSAGVAAEADLRALGPALHPPLSPILVCPEPTFEGYCKLTANGQPALGLFSAEGGSFIGGFGMSPDQKLKTAAGISSVWDGDPIKRVRAGDGALVLAGRRLSMHLMAQPEVAAQMLNDDLLMGQGLLSRVLVVAPSSTAGTRFFVEAPAAAQFELSRYCEDLARMVRVPLPLREGTRNELEPRKLVFTEDAKRIWIGLHDHIEKHLGRDEAFASIAGLANKASEHAARLAALQVLWCDLEASELNCEAMANGSLLVQHYLTESLRLRSTYASCRLLRLAQRVLEWLQSRWPEPAIYAAVIYNDCPIRDVRERKTAIRIIAILEEHGWLHRLQERVRISGAYRKEAWRIDGRTLP